MDAVDIVSEARDKIKKDRLKSKENRGRHRGHVIFLLFHFMRVVDLSTQSKPVPLSHTCTVTPTQNMPSYPQLRQLT